MIKSNFEVEVWDIQVDRSYYSFQYLVRENGEEIERDEFASEHVWAGDRKGFIEELENGYAVRLALESII